MPSKPNRIDLNELAFLEAITPPGASYTQEELADILGVSHAAIGQLERRAKKRIRNLVFSHRHEYQIAS